MTWLVRIGTVVAICGVLTAAAGRPATVEAIRPPFAKVWEFQVQDQIENYVRSGDAIYFGTLESYGAVVLATGRKLWETSLAKDQFGAHVAFDEKVLYAAIGQGSLVACTPKNGKVLWRLPRMGYSGPMTVHNGILYCELKDGVLTALSTRTRKSLWTLNLEPRPLPKRSMRDLGLSADPLISGGRLFIGTNGGEVICLNPKTGKVRWRHRVSGGEDEVKVPGLAADTRRLYFTTDGGQLHALYIQSGKPAWRFVAKGYAAAFYDRLTLAKGLVVFGTDEGMLYAVDASNGHKKWQATLSRERDPMVSPPAVYSGQILATANSKLAAYDSRGSQLWEWNTEQDLDWYPIIPLPGGVVVPVAHGFYRFRMGEPAQLPSAPAERQALAEKLVGRLDKLSKDDKRTLVKLDDDAFEPVLQIVQERLAAYEKLADAKDEQGEKAADDAYSKLDEAFEVLQQVAHKKRTSEMLKLLRSARTPGTRHAILGWLGEKGDQDQTISLFLDILRKSTADWEDCRGAEYIALDAVARSTDTRAAEFLIGQLNDTGADSTVRRAAFTNLARTGGEEGLRAVLAARDTRRDIPALGAFMNLDELGTNVKPKSKGYEWPWEAPAKLLDTRKDSKGVLWGLFSSRAVGSLDDLWIAHRDGELWGEPLFTGSTREQLGKTDWFKRFVGKADLAIDTDGDAWTDLIEKRIGTNPKNPDTDGDGPKDSQDKNPLAAPRALSEAEHVLRAAFEARFQMGGARPSVCLVNLPKGIKPFELCGWDWVTITVEDGRKSPLDASVGKGVGGVSFYAPVYDFAGNAVRSKDKNAVILWNKDRTEAKLQISTHFGGLDGTGFDMHLKKFGNDWVVINSLMVWIS